MSAPPTLNTVTSKPIASSATASQAVGFWADAAARLRGPGAVRWYWGSIWGVVYLAIPTSLAWTSAYSVQNSILFTALMLLIAAVYVVLPPLIWGRPWWAAGIAFVAFTALTCLSVPFIAENVIWLWIYVPVLAAMSWQSRGFVLTALASALVAQLLVMALTGTVGDFWYATAITASVGIMMFAFAQQLRTVRRLRDAQSEIARLAVVDERERFARDMHDVLGHSLTVVTVKSELARKLVARDPERAEQELADIERLARAALADLRASVAGYRAMSLETELSAAHAALVAADVAPHLPTAVDVVAPELRETFAWVLRESVTNVVRHANAKNCWVAVEKQAIIIGDDGRGMPTAAHDSSRREGHGLEGLRERAAKVGATVAIEPGDEGGTTVTVRVRGGAGAAE